MCLIVIKYINVVYLITFSNAFLINMTHIFTLGDEEEVSKLNLDELYEKERTRFK